MVEKQKAKQKVEVKVLARKAAAVQKGKPKAEKTCMKLRIHVDAPGSVWCSTQAEAPLRSEG